MKIYVLTSEKLCEIHMVSEDEELVVNEAISRSVEEDIYTFIIETWENGNFTGKPRYYRRGKETSIRLSESKFQIKEGSD